MARIAEARIFEIKVAQGKDKFHVFIQTPKPNRRTEPTPPPRKTKSTFNLLPV